MQVLYDAARGLIHSPRPLRATTERAPQSAHVFEREASKIVHLDCLRKQLAFDVAPL